MALEKLAIVYKIFEILKPFKRFVYFKFGNNIVLVVWDSKTARSRLSGRKIFCESRVFDEYH